VGRVQLEAQLQMVSWIVFSSGIVAGLPDGTYTYLYTKNPNLGLGMETVGIFSDHC
jgi:hypothetical protein